MLLSHFRKNTLEAGCDEAGRGCLAGSVFAAAVILPSDYKNKLLDDSKKLSAAKRFSLREIIQKEAVAWKVAEVDREQIDTINILNASFLAMHHAIQGLKTTPELLLIDGNRFKPFEGIPHQCIIGGDAKYLSIAAASILAKTYRDEYMDRLHDDFPFYGWDRNKGYGTKVHQEAIRKHGPSPHHRTSFRLLPEQTRLSF
jgi:ribonuclease HII